MVDRISMDHHLKIDHFQKVTHRATMMLWDQHRIIDPIYSHRQISTKAHHKIVQISILQMQITHPTSSSIIPVLVAYQVDLVIDKTIMRMIGH